MLLRMIGNGALGTVGTQIAPGDSVPMAFVTNVGAVAAPAPAPARAFASHCSSFLSSPPTQHSLSILSNNYFISVLILLLIIMICAHPISVSIEVSC